MRLALVRAFMTVPCFGLALMLSHPAKAGTFDKCGARPQAPSMQLDTVAHFNVAVDQFQKFQKQARAYDDCVIKQARVAEELISTDARKKISAIHEEGMAEHNLIAKKFEEMAAAFTKASAKLKKSG